MESDDPADIKKTAGCAPSCIPASIEHAHRCHRRQAVRLEGNPPAAARIDPKRTLDLPHRGVLRVAIPNPFSSKTGFRRERRGVVRVLIEATHPVDPCAEAIPRYCRAFLLATYQLQASAFITGDTYEKWKKDGFGHASPMAWGIHSQMPRYKIRTTRAANTPSMIAAVS